MPKSKSRGRGTVSHYIGGRSISLNKKARISLYGRKSRPVPGSSLRVKNNRSKYLGSVITAATRNAYEVKQAKGFKDNYTRDVIKKRSEIEQQTGKTEEEILEEVSAFNAEQISEEELDAMSKRFARFQSNKENKHYKAWLAGKQTFFYKGKSFPVLTESFMKKSKSIKEIIPENE